MPDSLECVNYVKSQMEARGISSTHISRKRSINVFTAEGLLQLVKELEQQFIKYPSHDLVLQMMDLLRESTECFGEANDDRYHLVVLYVQNFLCREDVTQILDRENGVTQNHENIQKKQQEEEDQKLEENKIIQSDLLNFDSTTTTILHSPAPPTSPSEIILRDLDETINNINDVDEIDEVDETYEENKYLPTLPINFQLVDPSFPIEALNELNEAILLIDQDEKELGQQLNDISCELDEILGTHVEIPQLVRQGSLGNNHFSKIDIYSVSFEEFETFIEELG